MNTKTEKGTALAELRLPIQRKTVKGNDVFVLEFEVDGTSTEFECTPQRGGLITGFSLDNKNVLADDRVGLMFGSTFWTSPQSDWDWPPPEEIDMDSYSVDIDESSPCITLSSKVAPGLGVQVIKRFSVDLTKPCVVLDYEIKNQSEETKQYAPWEISRVFPGGMTYYPQGKGDITNGPCKPLPTTTSAGITWFNHVAGDVPEQHKLFADGARGWIAHATEGLLFVKTFTDTTPEVAAPGEGEIEIYATPEYVEVEQQGAYAKIPAGSSLTWRVKWHLMKVPADIDIAPGSQSLISLADALV